MIKFKDIPFYRLDMVSYKRHFEEELERFSNAKTMEEAYDAMLDLGYTEADVYVKTGLSENEKKKLMIDFLTLIKITSRL